MMELPIELDKSSAIPLYAQIEQQIRLLIQRGVVKAGDMMPTGRSLAVALGVNLNTVARVYRDLEQGGVLSLKRGVGTFVAGGSATQPLRQADLQALDQKAAELVLLARRFPISRVELLQLVETRWKELVDGQR
jgi:GntR family transcriptional regulator